MALSTAYYDNIAKEYNGHMTNLDEDIRKEVLQLFHANIPSGNIMDFGGGTGLDLRYLLCDKYKVHFLEPAPNMRLVAKNAVSENIHKLIFAENHFDFHNWSEYDLPFEGKMNGILANFAVLNCIPDIDCLFKKLSLIADNHCYVQATVLDTRPEKMMNTYSIKIAIKSFLNMKLKTQNFYHGITQVIYLHTIQQYKSASKKYFDVISYTPIYSSHFASLILQKK